MLAERPAQVVVEVVRDVELNLLVTLGTPFIASVAVTRPAAPGTAIGDGGNGTIQANFASGENILPAPDVAVSTVDAGSAPSAQSGGMMVVLVQYN